MLNNVPLSGQSLNETRLPINQNWTLINAGFLVDHVELNTSGAGRHKGVHIVDGVPNPVTSSTEIGLYNTVTAGVPDLFIQKGTGTAINITSLIGDATQGAIDLPTGLKVKWGRGTTASSGLATVNFTAAFNTVFQVNASIAKVGGSANPNSNDRIIQVYNYTTALFSVVTYLPDTARNRSAADYVWFALGI
jgi:hypothetical protein